MPWIIIAYLISVPIAVWIELTSEPDDGVCERLRQKASDGFTSVAWMFDSGFMTFRMIGVVLIAPAFVGFIAIAFVVLFPIVAITELVFGVELLKDAEAESGESSVNGTSEL